jgi:hypothetical protein
MHASSDAPSGCRHEGGLLLESLEGPQRLRLCEPCLRVEAIFAASPNSELEFLRRLAAKARGSLWRSQGRLYVLRAPRPPGSSDAT